MDSSLGQLSSSIDASKSDIDEMDEQSASLRRPDFVGADRQPQPQQDCEWSSKLLPSAILSHASKSIVSCEPPKINSRMRGDDVEQSWQSNMVSRVAGNCEYLRNNQAKCWAELCILVLKEQNQCKVTPLLRIIIPCFASVSCSLEPLHRIRGIIDTARRITERCSIIRTPFCEHYYFLPPIQNVVWIHYPFSRTLYDEDNYVTRRCRNLRGSSIVSDLFFFTLRQKKMDVRSHKPVRA
jgi:hypothetical protein